MWPWRRRSPVGDITLPKKVFISHSYQDTGAREQLLKVLPKGVEPFVFPPITVAPEEMVSDKLLDAIRACDGLVYVQEGASADSFWVALERDYALRIGKPVFAFTPSTASLSRDSSAALTMKVFLWYSMPHVKTAERLADMLRQRYIEPWLDIQGNHPAYEKLAPALQARGLEVTPENVQRLAVEIIARAREQAQNEGGYLVALWSADEERFFHPLKRTPYYGRLFSGRWLFALIEDPATAQRGSSQLDQMEALLTLAESTASRDVPNEEPVTVQLYGDRNHLDAHRIDDLIVRLYWLIFRNTRQNQLS